jgi:ATP-dependent helicase/nuclease subunit B
MSLIQVVESPAASDRLDAARAFVESFPTATEMLIVGASREAADDLARVVTAGRGTGFGIHRYSVVQLAVRLALAGMAPVGDAPTTALGKEAIAARLVFEALRAGTIAHYAPVASFPGFPHALASTLDELRLNGADPDALSEAGEAGADVGELLRRLDEHLRDGRLADSSVLLRIAAQAAEADPPPPVLGMPLVLLDVAIESPAHAAFIAAAVARSPSALITIPAGDDAASRAVSGMASAARSRGSVVCLRRPSPRARGPAATGIARLQAYLFSEELPSDRGTREDVVLFSAPGESRECVEIARRVLEEAAGGVPFDRMAILLRAPGIYAGLLETALARAGIPAFFARGTRRPDPAGRAFLALIDCALEGSSAKRFAEYLSLGQVPPLDSAGAPPTGWSGWIPAEDDAFGPAAAGASGEEADGDRRSPPGPGDSDRDPVVEGSLRTPWKWEELLVEAAVIGGRDRWSRRLDGLAADYRLRLEALREEEPESPRVPGLERELRNLEHLRRFALPVIDQLAALPLSASWGEWIPVLERLAPLVLRRPQRVLAVLAQLRPLAPIGPVALAEVRRVLAPQLRNVEEQRPDNRYGRVFVATADQVRGRAFEIVFVPGLAERIFPRKPREDPLLLDDVRRRLGKDLETQDDRSRHERLLLRLAAGAAVGRLYLSYSRVDVGASRARVASFYALEVERALTGRVPDPQTLEREADASADARLAWPAPRDPGRAIDEVEHDLATLHELLALPPAEARGRARYLLELNGHLARSLRARWQRWKAPWTPVDGIVRMADGTAEALAASRPTARAYSVSALQKFAVCPYQFFLSAICRLEPREQIAPLEQLDPLTRGRFFHRVQADLMRALAQAGELPVTADGLGRAMERLDRTIDRVAAEYHEDLAPAIERVWANEVEALRVDLRMWLERSVETQATWEPIAFEFAFGMPGDPAFDARSVRGEVVLDAGYRLRGVVDLIERRRGAAELRVTDHKTGRCHAGRNLAVGGGETLQPALYSLAVERALGGRVAEARLFYATRAGEFEQRLVPMSGITRRRGLDVVAAIDDAISRGFLPPAPRERACGFCDFREICGPHEERRTAQKDQGPLGPLRALRSWP